jgi:hypothetical protein
VTNVVVDPYDINGWVRKPGFNDIKPHAGANGAMAKAYQVERSKPRTLILGNSRAEVGFNPQSAAWPREMQPVFNLALPGTGPVTALRYLQHAIGGHRPTVVVLGVDFMDFLVRDDDATPRIVAGPAAMERRLRVTATGEPNLARQWQRMEDFAASTLSLDALAHSIGTILAQHTPYPAHLTPQGFNPMRDYEGIARREGYYVMFRQRDQENARAYLRQPRSIYLRGTNGSPQFDVLRRLAALSREQGIELHLVIYPYHAHLLEIFHAAGLWPEFEEWKRALVRLADAESGRGLAVRLWDFSGYNPLTTESVPAPTDRDVRLSWYWEAGHFKQELGDIMLRRMFGVPGLSGQLAFGSGLTGGNLDRMLERIREERAWYIRSQPDDARSVRDMVQAQALKERRRGL